SRGGRRSSSPPTAWRPDHSDCARQNCQGESELLRFSGRADGSYAERGGVMTRVMHRLAQPWARGGNTYSIPGMLIVKLRLGEAPENLPSLSDVRRNIRDQQSFLKVEPVDRILKHFTDDCWVSQLHASRSAWR